MKLLKGYASILGATLFWGVSATIAKYLFSLQAGGIAKISTLVLVQMRMSISCILLIGILGVFDRQRLRIRRGDLPKLAALGIFGIAGSNFFYYYTIQQANVATAILLQYLAPLLVLVYAALSKTEDVTAKKIIAGTVSLIGCFLAVGGKDVSVFRLTNLGILSGFAAAFCWAFTNIWLRRLLRDYAFVTVLAYAFIAASCFWMLFNPPWKIVEAAYSAETWGVFIGFALISILIPHFLYFGGIRFLTASRAIITATFEPVIAIASAYLILGESLVPVQIVGAVIVIAAIAILQTSREHPAGSSGQPALVSPVDASE